MTAAGRANGVVPFADWTCRGLFEGPSGPLVWTRQRAAERWRPGVMYQPGARQPLNRHRVTRGDST